MTHTIDLRPRLRLAAQALIEKGWTTGTERDETTGMMCLTGAVKYCAPQTGDEYIIREVLRRRDRAEEWNDFIASGAEEVIGYLATADITDADLVDTFGPQALEIVAQVRRMYELTMAQWDRLAASWAASWDAAWAASWDAAWAASVAASRAASVAASRTASVEASVDASRDASVAASRTASVEVSRDASLALNSRDLIGQHGFTQEHYDLLSGPWRTTIGRLHPDDPDIFEADNSGEIR